MAYSNDFPAAARRHYAAAEHLNVQPPGRRDVAGYLYGIAAECAIKAMMVDAGMRPSATDKRTKGDPFYEHFPELRTLLRESMQGRKGTPLIAFIGNDAFLNNWSTRMRYSSGKEIDLRWVDSWREQARQAVASIGT